MQREGNGELQILLKCHFSDFLAGARNLFRRISLGTLRNYKCGSLVACQNASSLRSNSLLMVVLFYPVDGSHTEYERDW